MGHLSSAHSPIHGGGCHQMGHSCRDAYGLRPKFHLFSKKKYANGTLHYGDSTVQSTDLFDARPDSIQLRLIKGYVVDNFILIFFIFFSTAT
jgi:hypothetical protein